MGKNPAFQFYVLDFMDDADGLSATSNGIWIRLLCKLHRAPNRGEITATKEALCRKCNCSLGELEKFFEENLSEKVSDITVTDDLVTIKSRRMIRERKEREQANERQRRYQEKKAANATLTDTDENITPPSSSSSSSSKEGEGDGPLPHTINIDLIRKAQEIRDWTFTTEQDVSFFTNLLADHSEDLIFKVIEDLRVYQEKPTKTYKNLHSTLRNWCANEKKWQGENEDDAVPEKDLPLDDHGEPMVELAGGEIVSRKELGELIGFNAVAMTRKGWKRK